MSNFFDSKPSPGAVIYDCTNATIEVTVENSMGERYFFEINNTTPELK